MTRSSVLVERSAPLVAGTVAATHAATATAAIPFRALIRHHGNVGRAVAGSALAVFLAVGFLGVRGYLSNFLTYRGFAAPREPSYVTSPGVAQRILVRSPALGGRRQE